MGIGFLCRSPHPDSSARSNQEPTQELPGRKISLLARPFGLGWRDRNKVCFLMLLFSVCSALLPLLHSYRKKSIHFCAFSINITDPYTFVFNCEGCKLHFSNTCY